MPTYGFQRRARKRTGYPALGQRITVDASLHGPKRRIRKHYQPARNWTVNNTPYSTLVKEFGFSPLSFARKRTQTTGKPAVILDWGCGNGRAIRELSAKSGNMARCYGYGKDSFPEWNRPSRVQFVQESMERAIRYFKRMGGIDLIYSHWGLGHIAGKKMPVLGVPQLNEYMKQLIPTLKIGGRIAMYPSINRRFAEECQKYLDPTRQRIRVRMSGIAVIIERLH